MGVHQFIKFFITKVVRTHFFYLHNVEQKGCAFIDVSTGGLSPDAALLAKWARLRELRDLVNKAGKRIAVLVERGNSRIFIPVELG